MSEHSPGLYLVRNFHTPFRHDHIGAERSHPSEMGEREAKETSAYINSLGLNAFVLVASPLTARSEVSANILGARLNRVKYSGRLFNVNGKRLCSPEEIAEEEANGLEGLLHYRNLLNPETPTGTPPEVVAVMSGGGISRYLDLPLSWSDSTHPSPWQPPLFGEAELPGGDDLIPTGAVVEPYFDQFGGFQIRGHAVDLLTAYVAERSRRVRSR